MRIGIGTKQNNMYRLKRLNSLFTSKRFLRRGSPVRSTTSSRLTDPNATITYKRKVLPPELSKGALNLTCESSADGGVCDVYVVGTCHYSKRPTMGEMVNILKENGILLGPLCCKFASEEVLPSSEFHAAYEEAKKYGGMVVFGDRPILITLRRAWAKMPLWHRIALLYTLLFTVVLLPIFSNLKFCNWAKGMDFNDRINLTLDAMMITNKIPTLSETLVYKRDQYMSAKLLEVARKHTSVVAVVGKGHLPGIKKNWKQPVEVEQLLIIPSEKIATKVGQILIGIGAAVAIIGPIYISIKK